MNKPSKVILPTINLSTDRPEHRIKKKSFKGWVMNDTFSNWRKRSIKNHSPSCPPESLIDSSVKGHVDSKSQLASGMTLGEYFRTRASTEHSCV